MTKWTDADRRGKAMNDQTSQTHVIWRGIGCLLMLIIPVMAFVLASVTVSLALTSGWPLPYQLLGNPVMPAVLWNLHMLDPLLGFIQSQANLYAILAFTVLYIVIMSAVITLLYAIVYRIVGPSRYGPLDAPPATVKVRSYKR